ncbi:ArsR family transcriptional regulator [Halobacteria archaeon AArc-m2/3/4]|uniref:ArsR family transcriptional regulator n=1 Tax=Natronoglomus mannanivorans TaxID=2979990 RepID=A0AAP2YXG8_9EURY|nr:ArsR family transcriptional regulator [Halobacteria archaeon AArc-xg1-1]MCU4975667.1 ArsR family transcriptional regulator [Halobacteria archaeon AArc-m2/3/4]
MTDSERFWEGDVNEAVLEEWKAETTPFERVKEVLLVTTSFQYAKSVAERARVSEPSARKHLNALVDAGFAEADDTGQGTMYKRSRETIAMRRIRELHSELTKDELVEGIRDLKGKIKTYHEKYDVTNPDDLAIELDADDGTGWAALSRWRALEENLKLAQAALSLYDFDPDREHDDAIRSDGTSRGAFAIETGDLSA